MQMQGMRWTGVYGLSSLLALLAVGGLGTMPASAAPGEDAGARAAAPASPRDVPHPFILWNDEDVKRIRELVANEPWAQRAAEKMLEDGREPHQRLGVDNLFRFIVFDRRDGVALEKQALLDFIAAPPDIRDSFDWQWHHVDHYEMALRFDALYDELTDAQRRFLLATFRTMAVHAIEREHLRTWEHYPRMASHAICALVTRDERIIRGFFNAPGGLREYFDAMIDGRFAPGRGNPPHKNLGHIMLWCRGVERLGLDELGFGYRSRSGVVMKQWLAGMVKMADPLIEVPGGRPFMIRSAMRDMGMDVGMYFSFPLRRQVPELIAAPLVVGHLPDGQGGWPHWAGSPDEKRYEPFMSGEARMHLPLVLELAHRRWPDGGFDFLLAQMRAPGESQYIPSLYWGIDPIDPAEVSVPAAPSMVSEGLGLALLRSEHGERYWTSPAPAATLQLPVHVQRRRPIGSYLGLKGLVAFNRPLYRFSHGASQHDDGANWAAAARAHNTVAVDNLVLGRVVEQGVYVMRPVWPRAAEKMELRQSFDGSMRFVGVRVPVIELPAREGDDEGKNESGPRVQQMYPGVAMERCLILTDRYMVDLFHLESDTPRRYHWLVHALGHGHPEQPGQWQSTDDLDRLLGPAREGGVPWIDARRRDVGDSTWSLVALQSRTPEAEEQLLGDGWYDREVGVRLTMLGEPDTLAYYARTPDALGARPVRQRGDRAEQRFALPRRDREYDAADRGVTELELLPLEPAEAPEEVEAEDGDEAEDAPRYTFRDVRETGGVSIIAGREAAVTTFIVLHEPFERGRWHIDRFRRIAQQEEAVAVAIEGRDGAGVDDRVLLTFGTSPERVVTLGDEAESYTFSGAVLVRIGAGQVDVTGDLRAMRLPVDGRPRLRINGEPASARIADGVLHYKE